MKRYFTCPFKYNQQRVVEIPLCFNQFKSNNMTSLVSWFIPNAAPEKWTPNILPVSRTVIINWVFTVTLCLCHTFHRVCLIAKIIGCNGMIILRAKCLSCVGVSSTSVADPGFPVGGIDLVGRRGLPRWLRFKNFVYQNERIWTLRGACAGQAPRSANTLVTNCQSPVIHFRLKLAFSYKYSKLLH